MSREVKCGDTVSGLVSGYSVGVEKSTVSGYSVGVKCRCKVSV